VHATSSTADRWESVAALLSRRRTTLLLLAAVALLFAAWSAVQVARNLLYDFNTYYLAAVGLHGGYDIYGMMQDRGQERWAALAQAAGVADYAVPYLYPPLTAQLVLPLTALPYRTAGLIWLLLSSVAMMGAMYLVGATSGRSYGPALGLLLLLLSVPALTTLYAGQVNGFVLLALAVAVAGLQRRNAWLAGGGVAVAAMLKVTPLLLLGYLLWRRQWQAAAVAAVGMAALLLASLASFPPATLGAYAGNFLRTGRPGELFVYPPNQGISGVLGRLLTGLLAEPEIYRLYLLAAAAVVLITLAVLWPPRRLAHDWPYEVGLLLCAVSLITPYVWYHHLVVLLIPLFFVTAWAIDGRRAGVLLLLALLVVLSSLHGLAWRALSLWAPLSAFPFALTVTLYILQVRARRAGEAVA
jgi:alpha-1,2-mannosyltransferase